MAADKQRIYFGGSDPFAKGPLFALTAGSSGDLTPEKTNGTFAGCAWTEAKGPWYGFAGLRWPILVRGGQ